MTAVMSAWTAEGIGLLTVIGAATGYGYYRLEKWWWSR